ncbi:tRNA 2-thiouridine(34) synthase MnmA, partial [Candidatus Peregrinibacteria bacterium]|nr:tRNA 2-thiouridine(34) synthase MnmA [Candidatus Peregrinibacteria bacterium]
MKKKVLLGMSGGIDSSVAAFLLKEQGYNIIGAYMNYWNDTSHIPENELHNYPENKCCSTESLFSARQIAAKLDFPLYTLNYQDNFKEHIVDRFLDKHKKGLTPNPCVSCNVFIKFGAFFEKMKELGCDYLATGHYARVNKNNNLEHQLYAGIDDKKDQSYFLYHLNKEQLPHILFPLGEITKKQTRTLAEKYELSELLHKKESQGVCFYPESSYSPFLQRYIPEIFKHGEVVYHGEAIGTHTGLPRYTIGQRRGIDIGGFTEPIYVIKLDYENNALIMGDDIELYKDKLSAKDFTLTGEQPETKNFIE